MQELRTRLFNSDFTEVSFNIINTKLAINETDGLSKLMYMAGDIPVVQEPQHNIPISWNAVLEGGVDHILVLDRCGRLAYQVIPPWSLLTYPYVKAAILSTYVDEPCGVCNTTLMEKSNFTDMDTDPTTPFSRPETGDQTQRGAITISNISEQRDFTKTSQEIITLQTDLNNLVSMEIVHEYFNNKTDEKNDSTFVTEANSAAEIQNMFESHNTDENYLDEDFNMQDKNDLNATLAPLSERRDGTVPIKIIMHSPHAHHHENGTASEHEYVVLQTGNPRFHGHLEHIEHPLQKTSDRNKIEVNKQKGKKYKGKNKHGKGMKNKESGEERSTEIVSHPYYPKAQRKYNDQEAVSQEQTTEISQDIREHAIPSSRNNSTELDNNIGGKKHHKQGRYHKKYKTDHTRVGNYINGTNPKDGIMKGKGHKKLQVSVISGNETNEEITVTNITNDGNRGYVNSDMIKKVVFGKSRLPSKNIRNEHQTENANEELNVTLNADVDVQNISLNFNSLNHIHKKPKHANTNTKPEDETKTITEHLNVIQDTDTHTNIHEASILQNFVTTIYPATNSHPEDSVQQEQLTTTAPPETQVTAPNIRNLDEKNASQVEEVGYGEPNTNTTNSSEENDESESRLTEFIEHYSKLMNWIDYPL